MNPGFAGVPEGDRRQPEKGTNRSFHRDERRSSKRKTPLSPVRGREGVYSDSTFQCHFIAKFFLRKNRTIIAQGRATSMGNQH
jgi:hypothetical protein